MKVTRRQVLKAGACACAGMALPLSFLPSKAFAALAAPGLSDPALQPKFREIAPNALDPGFLFKDLNERGWARRLPDFSIGVHQVFQQTGLINTRNGRKLWTRLYGYGQLTPSWPGQTIQVMSTSAGGADETKVRWRNTLLARRHLLPVDTNLHWCYGIHGHASANGVDYTKYSIEQNGIPLIAHLHGGNTDYQFDGNPEFFYSPFYRVIGPQWDSVPGGFTNLFRYNNAVQAGCLWYHDHALGITRLNVYAGLAGFYIVRDEFDTGKPDNPLGLPAFPYEMAYAIQDRMFTDRGALFYPAYPGDPMYADFITDEGAELPPDLFPDGGPTSLAEFFGDHMVVNGKIWPKENVEPRHYRMRLLNGCDSRFMVLRFRAAPLGATDLSQAGAPIPFDVIGSDQGLASQATTVEQLIFEPGSRYDIVVDFSGLKGYRVIMENIGGDEPFGGDIPGTQVFCATDRIMAFDVKRRLKRGVPDAYDPAAISFGPDVGAPSAPTRKVGLFEGKDEFGRLQPLLGVVNGDATATAYTWFQPTTETPAVDTVEEWEVYNFTGDAHPVHLHQVNFEILGRNEITFDVDEDNPQQVPQHNGEFGMVPAVSNVAVGAPVSLGPADGYVENAPKDMVTALPLQVTRIKAHFNKTGRYVWHCHILSHEDHEMMRVMQVE